MDLTSSLQFYRKRQGLSQIELAEALEVSRQTVSKWETGAALPSAENLAALGKLYGVAVDQLLNGPAEDAPGLLPADPPPAPPSLSPAAPFRQKLLPRLLAVVLLFSKSRILFSKSIFSFSKSIFLFSNKSSLFSNSTLHSSSIRFCLYKVISSEYLLQYPSPP